jgi:signal transduction histidine kinase
MRGGLTRRVAVACGLLLVIVAAAFVVLLLAIDGMRDSARQAEHSQAELTAAGALERRVVDLESGARGYVITHRERLLGPWRAARRAIPAESRRLVALTDDARQRGRARAIAAEVRSYLNDYSVPLVQAARRGDPSASSVPTTVAGKRRVDSIRARFDEYLDAERALVASRREDADDSAQRAVVLAGVGLAGSVILILLFSGYLTRAVVLPVRRAAAMARRLAGGDLSVRMPDTGPAEVGTLERSFNTMAESLEASHADLAESRARVVAASDETRRRIERDLHDGTQQRLVSLGLELRAAEAMVPPDQEELRTQLAHTAEGLSGAIEELQEISRGIHPAILSRGGLGPALKTLARRSAIPVELEVDADHRLPEPIEAATYYVVSEALTNAAKHSQATVVQVAVANDGGAVRASVRDDGVGGAAPGGGSGLIGLRDRVEALGGAIEIDSPSGSGTWVRVTIPVAAGPARPASPPHPPAG